MSRRRSSRPRERYSGAAGGCRFAVTLPAGEKRQAGRAYCRRRRVGPRRSAHSHRSEQRAGERHGRRGSAPDVAISGNVVQVRSERAESSGGRIYAITATATDLAGNTSTGTAMCVVPHDQRQMARP